MKYLFYTLLLLGVSASQPNVIRAQENAGIAPLPPQQAAMQCEDAIDSPNPLLDVLFDSDPIHIDAGNTLEILGTLANISNQPLSDVTVYARVYQSDTENPQLIKQLDEFMVEDAMNLAGNSDVPLQATWDVPNTVPSGEYYINLYVLSGANTYLYNTPYVHLPSEMRVNFTVDNGSEPNSVPYFDTTETGIDGAFYETGSAEVSPFLVYNFANPALATALRGETTFVTTINNPTDTELEVPVEWRQYASHSFDIDLLKHTETQMITVPAQGSTSVSFTTVDQAESQLYVTATLTYGEQKNVVSLGVNRTGVDEYALVLPTVYPFPLTAGEPATMSVCASTLNRIDPTDPMTLVMTAYDRAGEMIHQSVSSVLLTNNLQSLVDSFTATADYDYVQLSTVIMRDNEIIYSSDKVFDEEAMHEVIVEDNGVQVTKGVIPLYAVAAGVVLILIMITAVLYMTKRRQRSDTTTSDDSLEDNNATTP